MSEPILDATTFWQLLDRRVAASPDRRMLLDDAGRSDYMVTMLASGFPEALIEKFTPAGAVAAFAQHGVTDEMVEAWHECGLDEAEDPRTTRGAPRAVAP